MDTPLTVFYDASCGICNSEIWNIKTHDAEQRLILVDCSSDEFDDAPYQAFGITRDAMMECLHVRNSRGAWIKGVAAFELIYRAAGMKAFAMFWGGRYTRPVMEHIYPWVARHRRMLSWTGISIIFKLGGKFAAWRANRRSRHCRDGVCSSERVSS